jgi:hypothetical protein
VRGRTLLTVVALAVAVPSPAAAARADCWPRGSKTLKQSQHARVYSAPAPSRRVTAASHDEPRTYGCLYSTGRRVQLDWYLDGRLETDSEPPYRLAGRYVAQMTRYVPFEAYEGSEYGIDVIDLRSGRVVRSARYAWNDGQAYDPETPPDPSLSAFVLTRDGYAAWISNVFGDRQTWRLDSRGPKLLDAAKRLTSLRLADRRVHWRNDGSPRVASLR